MAGVVLLTVSPVKGHVETARGKHMLPLPVGPLAAQITEGLLPHCELDVHQGTAFGAGYMRLMTPSTLFPSTPVTQVVDPGLPSSVSGTPLSTGQSAGVLPAIPLMQVVAPEG